MYGFFTNIVSVCIKKGLSLSAISVIQKSFFQAVGRYHTKVFHDAFNRKVQLANPLSNLRS